MPIYEYVCGQCKKRFEALVRGSGAVQCPACKSASLEKQLSVFAPGRAEYARGKGSDLTTSPMSGSDLAACGDPRGPGACSLDD